MDVVPQNLNMVAQYLDVVAQCEDQGFGSGSGSGSVLEPYSIEPLDPDPDP